MIMPLANSRDKDDADPLGYRGFSAAASAAQPESLWLPETAVDIKISRSDGASRHNLMRFSLLTRRKPCVRLAGGRLERTSPELQGRPQPSLRIHKAPSGKSHRPCFFTTGPFRKPSPSKSFLHNGEEFAKRLTGAFSSNRSWNQLTHIATDGETYGHHHRHGEMALAYALDCIESKKLAKITNYGEFLEKNPPTYEAQIFENTSWSCVHGVERWRSNCGCNAGRHGWSQEWRRPLREALDWLRDWITPRFENLASTLLTDPWEARDGYITVVLNRSPRPARDSASSSSNAI